MKTTRENFRSCTPISTGFSFHCSLSDMLRILAVVFPSDYQVVFSGLFSLRSSYSYFMYQMHCVIRLLVCCIVGSFME